MPFVGGRRGPSIEGGFARRCGSSARRGSRRHTSVAAGYCHRLLL